MEELNGYFVGFKTFVSQKNGKRYNVLSVLYITEDVANQRATYFVKDIFVDDKVYNQIVENFGLMTEIATKREIVGDTVRYYI